MIFYEKLTHRILSVLHYTTLIFLAAFTNYAHSGPPPDGYNKYWIRTQQTYLPFSEIKKGAQVAHVTLDEKTVSTFYSYTLTNDDVYADLKLNYANNGCFIIGKIFSYILYDNGARLTSCPTSGVPSVASSVRLHYTGRYFDDGLKIFYEYQLSGFNLNAPLFDLLVADTDYVRQWAGKDTATNLLGAIGILSLTPLNKKGMAFFSKSMKYQVVLVHVGESEPLAFFPDKNSSHALLPLPVKPSGDLATGSASVDLCLYDGRGLSTSRYMLTFQDQNAANTGPYFAVYNSSGTGKIDYTVSLTDPSGTPQHVTNRNPFVWSSMQNGGAARDRLRYIQLPGSDSSVPCVPSVVTVKVKPVPYKSLLAGKYSGNLGIIFTPSTN